MKKIFYFLGFTAILSFVVVACSKNQSPLPTQQNDLTLKTAKAKGNDRCATIQSGTIYYSASHYYGAVPIKTGYDGYGYNYQAHLFKGSYANAYLGSAGFPPYKGNDAEYLAQNPTVVHFWAWPYRNTQLEIKWNDAWLSNKDCDGDGKLDRHFGFASYIGSGAWETNHMWGTYTDDAGKVIHWTDFVKIVAVPADATLNNGIWYSASGKEIGPSIWGEFATVQEVENDPGAGIHGIQYKSPDHPGFGGW